MNGDIEYDAETPFRELGNCRCGYKGCDNQYCRHSCSKCDRYFYFEHIGTHYKKGEFIPKGFGSGCHKVFGVEIESDEELDSDDNKEQSESDSESSDTWG